MNYRKIGKAFFKKRLGRVAFIIFAMMLLMGILAPVIAQNDVTETVIQNRFAPPSKAFFLGTDHLGRCNFSRLLYGMRISLGAAFTVITASMGIGTLVGSLCGYYGGKIDYLFMRLCEIILSFPSLIVVLVMVGVFGTGSTNVILGMIAFQWIWYVRLVRGLVMAQKNMPFIQAAKLSGASSLNIIFKQIIPVILPELMVIYTVDFGAIILQFSGYSFIGLGVQPPTPEWGVMIEEGREFIRSNPELIYYPGLALVSIVMSLNIIGDVLKDVLNERHF